MRDSEMETFSSMLASTIALACQCDQARLTDDTRLIDIGLDSVGLVSVVTQMEAACGHELGEEELVAVFKAERIRDITALMRTFYSSCATS